MKNIFLSFVMLLVSISAQANTLSLIGQYEDWETITYKDGNQKVCYSITTNNKGTSLMITSFFDEGIVNEPSFDFKDNLRKNKTFKVNIGKSNYDFFSIENRAWLQDSYNNSEFIEDFINSDKIIFTYETSKGVYKSDEIKSEGIVQAINKCHPGMYNEPDIFVETDPSESLPNEKGIDEIIPAASGSGFFISNSGLLITNNHVIEDCDLINATYKFKDLEAFILANDKINDLALIKIDTKDNIYYQVSEEDVSLLDEIIIAGFPLGKRVSSSIKTTKGVVTAMSGYKDNFSEFQTDAALNSGNSGGPIINQRGNIVGVAVAEWQEEGVEGFNFGIKSSTLRTFLNSNNIKIEKSSSDMMSNKELSNLILDATVYIECHMTTSKIMAIIAEGETRKAFFRDIN